jgi:hypothetical protein
MISNADIARGRPHLASPSLQANVMVAAGDWTTDSRQRRAVVTYTKTA